MKILLCGGGTGGHITPILAIAHELKRLDPDCKIIYVGEKGGKFDHLVKNVTSIDQVKAVYAGKFRRYHGQSVFKHLIDVRTNLLNLRDLFYVIFGIIQCYFWLSKVKPDVIYLKGSFVGMPVGLAAAMRKIKFITHDSDSIPSLTNKVVGKWAVYNTTGMPGDKYSYPKAKIRFVGIPVASEYEFVTKALMDSYRKDLNIPINSKMILVTGGSQGSRRVNLVFSKIVDDLLNRFTDLFVVHQLGRGNSDIYGDKKLNSRLKVYDFIPNMYKYSGASDLVITRSGANSIAELAAQGKATIIIPNPQLTGGHQVLNAEELRSRNATVVLDEKLLIEDPQVLFNKIVELIEDNDLLNSFADNLKREAIPNSAVKIALLLAELSK